MDGYEFVHYFKAKSARREFAMKYGDATVTRTHVSSFRGQSRVSESL